MSDVRSDVLIIGGGVIGLLTARELNDAGMRVRVVDQGAVGQESSWAGGGILSPLYPWRYPEGVNRLALWSQAAYPQLAEAVAEASGVDPEWTRNGMLMLDTSEQAQALAWAQRFGYRMELIGAGQVAVVGPGLAHAQAALWMPEVAQLRNPRLLKGLRRACEQTGVAMTEHAPVEAIISADGRVSGVATAQGRFEAARVVVAAGAWSGRLLAGLGLQLPVRPVRGQMLLFRAEPGVVSRIILGPRHYIIPRRDGRVLVGSTMEEVGFDKSTTGAAREELLGAAFALVPRLRDFPIERHWAGLRPGSPTGVPFIGAHPSLQGLYINSGHFRNGVVMAPASARLLADLLLERPPILDPLPYAI